MERHRNRLTVMPFLLGLMLGACEMAPTNVVKVNRDGMGFEYAQPWRSRAEGAVTRTLEGATMRLQSFWKGLWGHPMRGPAVTMAAVAFAAWLQPDSSMFMAVAGVVATREQLLAEAAAFRNADGTFPNDQARAAFDAKIKEVEALDARGNDDPESIVERDPLDPGAPTTETRKPAKKEEPTDSERGAELERARIQGITNACRAARMPTEFMDKLISERTSLVDAQAKVFEELRKRGYDHSGPSHTPSVQISGKDDPLVHQRAGIEEALLHRLQPSAFKLTDKGRKYRGMTLLDTAKIFLQARGHRVTDLSKNELAGMALGLSSRGGMHTTSDFTNLLADVANKSLRRAYDEAPQTFRPLVSQATLTDFKPVNRVQFGDAPALLEIDEHGEFTAGTISDGKVSYQLTTYGRKFAITRKAIINDDTDAFARIPAMFGRKARILESNIVWGLITANGVMADGNALFSIAHANLATTDAAIDVTSLGAGRAALRKQTSLDGDLMNLSARYLLVGPDQETLADQYVTVVQPQQAGNVNPFQGRLTVIAEPRLGSGEPSAWWLAASPDQVDMIEIGYLDGEEGPMVESMPQLDVDGLVVRARLDFAAAVIDYRGFYKNEGSTGA